MKHKTSKGRGLTGLTVLCLLVAAVVLTLHPWADPIGAQEQQPAAQQPPASVAPSTPPAEAKPSPEPAAAPQAPEAEKPPADTKPAEETKPPAETKPPTEKSEPAKETKESEAKAQPTEELTNQSCMECHNPDILKLSEDELAEQVVVEGDKKPKVRAKPKFVMGKLNLSINENAYAEGVHVDTTCVTCHKDVEELPHKMPLKVVDCKECHDESVDAVMASAHGTKAGPKAPGCIGCHDVHYGKAVSTYEKEFKRKLCIECHKAYGRDTIKDHRKLYEPVLHTSAMECMTCHAGKGPGVHNIEPVKTRVMGCEQCHNKYTVLSKEKKLPSRDFAYMMQTGFINSDALKKYGYMVGAHRIPALDMLLILVVLGPLALPVVHGGLRILTRRKEHLHLPEEKILLHPLLERIWHWVQALCIVMLIITGAILHWPEKFHGWFQWAVKVHNWFGVILIVAFLVWLIYNLVTGRIRHYIPRKGEIPGGMITQAKFYGYGIFKHEPHPYAPTEDNKFNPLQKIAYLQFQVLLMPLLLITGVLYMYPECFKGIINAIGGTAVLGVLHLILAGLFAAFLVAHLYLATTGETIGENFKAIIFGYGIKSDHDEHK
jgi:thiosulfate reductase cytochrome b subunit